MTDVMAGVLAAASRALLRTGTAFDNGYRAVPVRRTIRERTRAASAGVAGV